MRTMTSANQACGSTSLNALPAHPGVQIGDQRRAKLLANCLAPSGARTVDGPLDLEQASICQTVSGGEITAEFLP